jgi:hypothetical protein
LNSRHVIRTALGVTVWLLSAGAPPADAQQAQAPQRTAAGNTSVTADGRVIFGPPAPEPPEVVSRDEQGRATVRAVRLTQPLELDGTLDEDAYSSVKPLTGFIQSVPDIGKPVSQRTEAWVFFDEDNIYVACRCFDTAPPSEWVANEMRRDGPQIRQNDNFGVLLDTFYDRRNGNNFYVNPLGGMMDIQYTNEGSSNSDWNTVWDVRTSRFDGGWSVEIQIPFKSLRYRPGASQVWGIQIRRGIRRRNEWAYLTPMPPDGSAAWQRISMLPTLVGLEVPALGKNVEIKPYGIGGIRTDRTATPAVTNDPNGEFGFDVKYSVTQNMTLDLTYNTDFAQVEVDEQQVNLTRFNLVFPEKREFFLEGRGLYEFGRGTRGFGAAGNIPDLFFSRQIGLNRGRVIPITGGARMTGKVGKFSFGAVNMQTEHEPLSDTPKTNFTVLRLRRDLLRRSSVGVMLTNRSASVRAPGESNQAYGVDGSFSFYQNVNVNGFYAKTRTPGIAGNAGSYQAHFDYSPDLYAVAAEHLFIGDAFNPEVGFVRRGNMRRTYVAGRFSPRPKAGMVRRFSWEGSVDYIADTAGRLETRQQALTFDAEFQNSDRFSVDYNRNYELLVRPFGVSRDITIPAGGYAFDTFSTSYSFGPQRRWAGNLSFGQGAFYDGRQTSLGFGAGRVELTLQFSFEPSVSINWIDLPYGDFSTQIYRARSTYTFTPRMFVSGLVQFNQSNRTVSTNVRMRWEYIPGSEFFVVYTEDRDTAGALAGQIGQFSPLLNRGLVVKFNRLLRF